MSDLPVKAYLVETEHSQAVILDHARALDYAAQHHGTIEPLVRLKDVKEAYRDMGTDLAEPDWISWHGGDNCPIPPSARVQVKYRDGMVQLSPNVAGCYDWRHDGGGCDLVAYKLA